jgi:hypothetical protein
MMPSKWPMTLRQRGFAQTKRTPFAAHWSNLMTNNQTDWKELCVQLYAALEAHSTTWDDEVLLDRVGTALRLAQSEPQGPTDEELLATAKVAEHQYLTKNRPFHLTTVDEVLAVLQGQQIAFARAVLARWGKKHD